MYSDKDILDLFENLQEVGAAETPMEEAERHRKIAKAQMGKSSCYPSVFLIHYLKENEIPHTYLAYYGNNKYGAIIPVIKGYVITTDKIYTIEEYTNGYLYNCIKFGIFDSLQTLKDFIINNLSIDWKRYNPILQIPDYDLHLFGKPVYFPIGSQVSCTISSTPSLPTVKRPTL